MKINRKRKENSGKWHQLWHLHPSTQHWCHKKWNRKEFSRKWHWCCGTFHWFLEMVSWCWHDNNKTSRECHWYCDTAVPSPLFWKWCHGIGLISKRELLESSISIASSHLPESGINVQQCLGPSPLFWSIDGKIKEEKEGTFEKMAIQKVASWHWYNKNKQKKELHLVLQHLAATSPPLNSLLPLISRKYLLCCWCD